MNLTVAIALSSWCKNTCMEMTCMDSFPTLTECISTVGFLECKREHPSLYSFINLIRSLNL